MESRKVDRAAVRELVRKEMEELIAHAKAGGNVHQKALDQKDFITDMTSRLSPEDSAAFYAVYAEEMNAKSAEVESQTARIGSNAEPQGANEENVGKILVGSIFIVLFLYLLFKLIK